MLAPLSRRAVAGPGARPAAMAPAAMALPPRAARGGGVLRSSSADAASANGAVGVAEAPASPQTAAAPAAAQNVTGDMLGQWGQWGRGRGPWGATRATGATRNEQIERMASRQPLAQGSRPAPHPQCCRHCQRRRPSQRTHRNPDHRTHHLYHHHHTTRTRAHTLMPVAPSPANKQWVRALAVLAAVGAAGGSTALLPAKARSRGSLEEDMNPEP
jgi:hypothetical protein